MIPLLIHRINLSELSIDSWLRNSRSRKEIFYSYLSNNPSYGLLNAWSELETDVRFHIDLPKSQINSDVVIKECTKTIGLSSRNKKRLKSISQMRNGVAHALPKRQKPTWSDVIFVLRIARKYRRMKQ
ncbi:MAG: hypothetical protein VXV76_01855 [Candidatus Thermoplasmatota archaeon]|nr:hypothetical protein [Candidatus Thermoplasmatota archaeon]